MANLRAVGYDGLTTVYLAATGEGTDNNPYVSTFQLDDATLTAIANLIPGFAFDGSRLSVATGLDNTLSTLNDKIPQLSLNGDRLLVDANVSLPSSYTVDGAVSVLNFPATQAISGTVTANTGLSQPLTDAQLRSSAVNVTVENLPATQAISAASLPLPTGAATSAKQDSILTALAGTLSVNTGLTQPLTDSQLRASAIPVSVSNFPATQAVSGTVTANQGGTWNIGSITTLPNLTLASEAGFLSYRNTSLSNTAQSVKAFAGSVMGWNFINSNTVPVYVKFFNIASGSVVVGTSSVSLTIMVPPSDGITPGMFFLEPSLIPVEVFSTAISIACVTGLADSSNIAPTTPIHVSVRYK